MSSNHFGRELPIEFHGQLWRSVRRMAHLGPAAFPAANFQSHTTPHGGPHRTGMRHTDCKAWFKGKSKKRAVLGVPLC